VEDAKEPFTLKRYRVGRCYNWGVHEGEVESCMSYLGATFIAPKITRDYIPITVPSLEIRVIENEDVIRKRLREKDIPLARTYDKPWFDLEGVKLHKRLVGTTGMIWAVEVKDFKAFCKVVGLTPYKRPRLKRIWPKLPEGMEWSDFALENYEKGLKKFAELRGVLDIEKLKETIDRKVTDVLISDLIIETRRFRKVKEDYDRKLDEILNFLRKELKKLYRQRRGEIFPWRSGRRVDQVLLDRVTAIFHGLGDPKTVAEQVLKSWPEVIKKTVLDGWLGGVEALTGYNYKIDVKERTARREVAARKKILDELRNLRIYINEVQSLSELSQYAHIYAWILEIFPEAEKEGEKIWPKIKDFLTYQEKEKQVATFREADFEEDEPDPDSEFTDTQLFYNRILEIFPEEDRSVLDSEVTDRQLFDFVRTIMSITRLSKREEEVIRLHYLEGNRVVEIAEMLRITRSDVYFHRNNALRKLRKVAERLLKEGKVPSGIKPPKALKTKNNFKRAFIIIGLLGIVATVAVIGAFGVHYWPQISPYIQEALRHYRVSIGASGLPQVMQPVSVLPIFHPINGLIALGFYLFSKHLLPKIFGIRIDLIRYVNRAFYLLHVGKPLGFRTEEVVTDANATATALELYRHLNRLKKASRKRKNSFSRIGYWQRDIYV